MENRLAVKTDAIGADASLFHQGFNHAGVVIGNHRVEHGGFISRQGLMIRHGGKDHPPCFIPVGQGQGMTGAGQHGAIGFHQAGINTVNAGSGHQADDETGPGCMHGGFSSW